jgi:hypothetical protein
MACRKSACREVLRSGLTAFLLLAMAGAAPVDAQPADPGRSFASVQAPGLAPGVSGSAPLYGELAPSGAFSLRTPAGAVATGNAFYDAFLHRTLGGTIQLVGGSPRVLTSGRRFKTFAVMATVQVAGRAATVPMMARTFQTGNGTWLRSSCRVDLAPYGVRTATGGSPGPLRVTINAFFPGH